MIRWFAQNGVAANLLAAVLLVAGFFMASTIKLELFPELQLDTVRISVTYPGASPEEVESGVLELIEDRIRDLSGIRKLTATAAEGSASMLVEVERGRAAGRILERIQTRIDGIDNFPAEAEEPTVEEIRIRGDVISLAITGETDRRTLKAVAERIRDRLRTRENITQAEIKGMPDFEISVYPAANALRRHDLSFDDLVRAIRENSVDIPGGSIRSEGGKILLRTPGQADDRGSFAAIPVRTREDGSILRLGQIADIEDGFVEDPLRTEFNGEEAVVLRVYAAGNESVLDVAERVRLFADEIRAELPAGIGITPFRDFTFYLKDRLQMLIKNGIYGFILIVCVLALFLRPSLAFFVVLGIPISFLGAFLFLPSFGITINLASLFGFILVLGILVDDAIIVGESVFTEFQRHGGPGVEASVAGTRRVAIPVVFAILTTVVAFLPVLAIPGVLGKFFFPIPVVVILCLLFSLVASKLILPYHLTLCRVGGRERGNLRALQNLQRGLSDGLERFVERFYRPFLKRVITFRYTTACLFTGLLLILGGLFLGKHLAFVFFPPVPSDYIVAKLIMPKDAPAEATERAVRRMESALDDLIARTKAKGLGQPFETVVTTIGAHSFEGNADPFEGDSASRGPHLAEIAVELVKREELAVGGKIEELSAPNLANEWRERIGAIPGAVELSLNADAANATGEPIAVQLAGNDFPRLRTAARKLEDKLATYDGLFDITNSYREGSREIHIDPKPAARALGLTRADIGEQVRAAFFGIEAQRIQRGRDDVKVMVRAPIEERRTPGALETLRIRTPEGGEVPLQKVAGFSFTRSPSTIRRVDGRRVIRVTADANKNVADLGLIQRELGGRGGATGPLPELRNLFDSGPSKEDEQAFLDRILGGDPDISWNFEGEVREEAEIFASLGRTSLIALFVIYALLAIPLRSYLQPFIVMVVIPFGLIGAVGGHLLLAQPMSILSVLGFVALGGVVVNDSLVLIDFINQERNRGRPLHEAIEEAGALRFRPIVLTSLTTFVGLLPILFETSLQAQFLIPMAISLSFGVLFATVLSLLLVPAFYRIIEDLRALFAHR